MLDHGEFDQVLCVLVDGELHLHGYHVGDLGLEGGGVQNVDGLGDQDGSQT